MCLLVFAHDAHPRYRLVVAANRDELFHRPAERAHAWGDRRGIVAGVDVEAGGTWLGITAGGRFAALTNYRDPKDMRAKDPAEPSRGALVRGFLESDAGPRAYVEAIGSAADRYRGFNLIAGDARELAYFSNRDPGAASAPRAVGPGIHGLSNHLLDTPWPKVRRGKTAIEALIKGDREIDPGALLDMMEDETRPPDGELPDTGVGIALERSLSPMFIRMPAYGTRCSTALLVERTGRAIFVERTHAPERLGDVRIEIAAP